MHHIRTYYIGGQAMTVRQHVRALVRFFGAQTSEGEAFVIGTVLMMSICSIYSLVAWTLQPLAALGNLVLYLCAIVWGFRVVFGLLPALGSRRIRSLVVQEWQELGAKPLWLATHERRLNRKWLRSQGVSRKRARQFAAQSSGFRRAQQYASERNLPWGL